jgi:hypothetical protein
LSSDVEIDQGSDFICDFRAMLSLSGPVPSKFRHPGLVPTLVPTLCCPLLAWYPPFVVLLVLPPTPCRPFVACAAAANVNSHTRLSHMTSFIGCDWCTHERCRPMMQKSQNFRQMIPRALRLAREISQDFPRIFRESQTTPRARAPTHNPTPTQPPLKPGA